MNNKVNFSINFYTPPLWRVGCISFDIVFVCMCVCVGLLRVHYTPLQRYMGYLCSRKAQYAPWCTRETIFFEKFRGPWWLRSWNLVQGHGSGSKVTWVKVKGEVGWIWHNCHDIGRWAHANVKLHFNSRWLGKWISFLFLDFNFRGAPPPWILISAETRQIIIPCGVCLDRGTFPYKKWLNMS